MKTKKSRQQIEFTPPWMVAYIIWLVGLVCCFFRLMGKDWPFWASVLIGIVGTPVIYRLACWIDHKSEGERLD